MDDKTGNKPSEKPENKIPPSVSEPDSNQTKFDWGAFLNSPQGKQALSEIPGIIREYFQLKEGTAKLANKHFLYITVFLFTLGFGTVVILTLFHGISAEGTAFLLGALLTGAIAVIRDFLGGSGD